MCELTCEVKNVRCEIKKIGVWSGNRGLWSEEKGVWREESVGETKSMKERQASINSSIKFH